MTLGLPSRCSRRSEEAENVDERSIRLLTSAATSLGDKCGFTAIRQKFFEYLAFLAFLAFWELTLLRPGC